MRPNRDPEGEELRHLLNACDLNGKNILEIGCGDGKFTQQYAHQTRVTIGIDPAQSDLQIAANAEAVSTGAVYFAQAMGENLPFPSATFDFAIFASSL